ncbi:MDR family MFS transporter [Salsuginibacillus kocurii]|uniref:MDR family MFS transporter n=1 Tax=Salsuginibacillus kocurii TaxID=427078 RepID=UPI0003627D44|nr:MDR family MFS transporter [Salsuginibacillus kocurii]
MNTATTQTQEDVATEETIKRLPIMVSLIIGVFFAILNETLLNVAYTDLMAAFNVTAPTVQWLTTSFMLVVGVLVPISALLVQWFTTRQMFIGAMTIFTVGTLVCAIAPAFSVLLIGRLLQAAGTGLLLPVMMNTILLLYPAEKRGGAMGMMGLVIMFAPAIGPTLSGLIVETLNWRGLFYIVLPFSLFSIGFAYIYLKNVSEVTKPRVDVISIILSTLGFGGIVFGFSSVGEGEAGWSSPEVYLSLVIAISALLSFILRQLKIKDPILEFRVFKSPMFSLTTVLLIIMMMTMFSTMIILPMYFQGPLALSALVAGLALLPGGVLNGLMSPIAGRIFDRFGPRVLVIPGTLILVVVMAVFTQVSASTSVYVFVLLHTALMVGIAMVMMPGQTNGLNQLPKDYYPHGTAVINTLMQVSGAIGIALFIGIMSAGEANYLSNVSDPSSESHIANAMTAGVQSAFTVGLLFAVIAFILSLFMKRTLTPKDI